MNKIVYLILVLVIFVLSFFKIIPENFYGLVGVFVGFLLAREYEFASKRSKYKKILLLIKEDLGDSIRKMEDTCKQNSIDVLKFRPQGLHHTMFTDDIKYYDLVELYEKDFAFHLRNVKNCIDSWNYNVSIYNQALENALKQGVVPRYCKGRLFLEQQKDTIMDMCSQDVKHNYYYGIKRVYDLINKYHPEKKKK